ncbi:Pycsar system effector family protein [Ligilactobacillus murinus]|uniref:Pycsar system effector family protein n=1 Tax=Ligilactobacillus murinus TaxID=1622 RepID=UPI0013B8B12C|nr:Pycsar system effector family protein [Ligilactobacillus murinus]NEF85403.1 hypothetical protein [Ligilactobacillus murinus]NEF94500.1 hypothetical protein [Ligilactobacillus murinus]NEF96719.1 hypothetical protein [Ligilactobacillus murinus]NEG03516.1 hypothetical protein [Ligilactobacillus murinus]NEG05747.1 hypothetical protein [Ligilactobacillus murinus]
MKKDSNVYSFLEKQLVRTNEWLRYAETKNGVLLTLALACTTKFGEYIDKDVRIGIVITILSTFAILICLLSFFPVMGKKRFIRKSNEAEKVNLLFYKDVAQLSLDEYEKRLIEKYNVNSKVIDCYCQDLINEVIINSLITVRKNNFFKVACLFLSISITIYFMIKSI